MELQNDLVLSLSTSFAKLQTQESAKSEFEGIIPSNKHTNTSDSGSRSTTVIDVMIHQRISSRHYAHHCIITNLGCLLNYMMTKVSEKP